MPYLERTRRVGRSQAASIFWGLVSVFFAAAACYYFWKDHENETSANVLRDQVLTLQEQRETLASQKDKLQSSMSETETQLKTREEFLQDKETKLADEETRLEALGQEMQGQTQLNDTQAAVVRRFNETVRKLATDDTDVVLRAGRPVLRVPDSVLFAFGDTTLTPGGKALLGQIAQALNGELGNFELRIDTFTDSDGESHLPDGTPVSQTVNLDGSAKPAAKAAPTPPHAATSWQLTGERAAAIAQYFHDETSLPFQDVLVVARADFQPIIATGNESHARNRRTEITLAPAPGAFHPPDAQTGTPTAKPAAKTAATAPASAPHAPSHAAEKKAKKSESSPQK